VRISAYSTLLRASLFERVKQYRAQWSYGFVLAIQYQVHSAAEEPRKTATLRTNWCFLITDAASVAVPEDPTSDSGGGSIDDHPAKRSRTQPWC
jgi:hypothetical protein